MLGACASTDAHDVKTPPVAPGPCACRPPCCPSTRCDITSGARVGIDATLPVLGTLVVVMVGPTVGRRYIDVSGGVTPKRFIGDEWFIGIAL